MKHWQGNRLLWVAALVLVALVVVAALPCGSVLHGPHDTCALCFLHMAEAPADLLPLSFVQETWIAPAAECRSVRSELGRSPRTSRGPPRPA